MHMASGSSSINNKHVMHSSAFSSPRTPKSDFHYYVESALSPVNVGLSPSHSLAYPSALDMNRIPDITREWSSYAQGASDADFAFNDSSPPPRMRHKKGFESYSSPSLSNHGLLSPAGYSQQLRHDSYLHSNLLSPSQHSIVSLPPPRIGIAEANSGHFFDHDDSSVSSNSYSLNPRNNPFMSSVVRMSGKPKSMNDVQRATSHVSYLHTEAGGYGYDRTPSSSWSIGEYTGAGSLLDEGGRKSVFCNCKKSRCLKLYCDCFRINKFCDGCNCNDCANLTQFESERTHAISQILERNPDAFKPRVTEQPDQASKGHLSGCHCKKSACLKKYCECFSGSAPCTDRCRCMDCKNVIELYSTGTANMVFVNNTSGVQVLTKAGIYQNSQQSSLIDGGIMGLGSPRNYLSSHHNPARSLEPRLLSPVRSLLELAGACEQQEATESLLALSPKPSQETQSGSKRTAQRSQYAPLNLMAEVSGLSSLSSSQQEALSQQDTPSF